MMMVVIMMMMVMDGDSPSSKALFIVITVIVIILVTITTITVVIVVTQDIDQDNLSIQGRGKEWRLICGLLAVYSLMIGQKIWLTIVCAQTEHGFTAKNPYNDLDGCQNFDYTTLTLK